ncbi:MAG: polyribonucleotide nucleotidyltransferase [candidate division Zixibacteria bacterium]|nr:polyribonucleotide nucleotidyltransferase [candidate division Zixibacteria bacterium]
MIHKIGLEIGGKELTWEAGRVAGQADGATLVRYGDTIILAAAVGADKPKENQDFFPLSIDYREKAYAAGKIPGGFFKREGRPSEKEILSSRLIDRPLRPLFPDHYLNEVQVMVTVLSSDQENDSDILGINGASAALAISSIPLSEPIGAVRVGRVSGSLVINPTTSQLRESDMNIIVAGTRENIIMVEGGAKEVSEEDLLKALETGHKEIKRIVQSIESLVQKCGKPKRKPDPVKYPEGLEAKVKQLAKDKMRQACGVKEKKERNGQLDQVLESVQDELKEAYPESESTIKQVFDNLLSDEVRRKILEDKTRLDGRKPEEIRPITCEVGILPRTHGSALFTRGQTQSLVVTTLGTKIDEQRIDDLLGETTKSYMLHYNFPPYSVGETKPVRGPGRREIGHGALAERALEPMIPIDELFPYTIRLVSDILESNGSSSMATVCGGSLALMDGGVPIKSAVAGIAMGLVKDKDKVAVLSDISGDEDHFGDMDFKVAGTREGITAFQMDVKVAGLNLEIMYEALTKAKTGRLHVLEVMGKTISAPRPELSQFAPRIIILKVKQDKIGDIIGPGGKIIRAIIEQTGAKIDIEDDGTVFISSVDMKAGEAAREQVLRLVEEPEIGKVYHGKVKKTATFGAFVEIIPGQDGLVHISEIDFKHINRTEDVLNVGDEVMVKVIGIDQDGKIKLSRKAVLADGKKTSEKE